ncbi:MAG: EAL domain-containing protein [Lachnospiraceae bacterium]|jgi:diguanylate cyclase (GGDEF)-like protein|nr:EAL domain-containing protein [Lachnospiraceae bacterium]
MEKYRYNEKELAFIEASCVPIAVYQFINERVVTIALSDGFCELMNFKNIEEAYDFMDSDMYCHIHSDDVTKVANATLNFVENGGEYNISYRRKRGDNYIVLHAIGKQIYKENGERVAVVQYTDEGLYNSAGEYKAVAGMNHDYLTGLPDMNYFFKLAETYRNRAKQEGKNLVMLFFNLKGMQAYNQRYGYAAGDELIKEVARLLIETFGHDNCCRTTADHFAGCAERDGIDECLAELIEKWKHINQGRGLPVKIGVYDTKYGMVGAATATDRAKMASDSCGDIFESKVAYFTMDMLHRAEERQYIYENLGRAMEEGWIKVHYQPIVRTSNGKVCNEEALVRWEDPEKGRLAPEGFIPILEDAKVMYKLDLYVLEQVIKKLKLQAETGLSIVPNSINLSKSDFYACNMPEEIRRRVDEAGIDRGEIVIELSERSIINDTEFMTSQVDLLRELGFSVWLDDFGQVYSSPELLQKTHFDVIKLDKSYVDQIDKNENSKIVIAELVRLASGLGSETVAEGVENQKVSDFLNEIGCTRLQGYCYGEPIDFEKILERNKRGIQIGFENPKEAEYYAALGNVNMYDMSSVSDEADSLRDYFDTMPMFIVEVRQDEIRHIKGNKSYKRFMEKTYPSFRENSQGYVKGIGDDIFFDAVLQCRDSGKPLIISIRGKKNDVIHLFIRKIATNAENDAVALSVVILGYVDNDAELRHKEELKRIKQERKIYARITALNGDIISIFAVDLKTDNFVRYVMNENYRHWELENEGQDFYEKIRENSLHMVYSEDRKRFLAQFTKENVTRTIASNGVFLLSVRLLYDGEPRYASIKGAIVEEDDVSRLIIGIVDVDSEVRKEQNYYRNLAEISKIANLDSLTGVKNKHAYIDAEAKLNSQIAGLTAPEFAIVVFDINGLKIINDTLGHQAGDEFIKEGCKIICNHFQHSPVYRVGGDEFVVIVQGQDYKNIDKIMADFTADNMERQKADRVVIASGMARYTGERSVSLVFERADDSMYKNKKSLKLEKSTFHCAISVL